MCSSSSSSSVLPGKRGRVCVRLALLYDEPLLALFVVLCCVVLCGVVWCCV